MLCQSMAPRSWLQAATLRTDPRPQDVAASWAAGSCDAMCWGPVENGFWWLMSPLLDQWRWYHFSDKYPYKPIWTSHALACFFRIQCGGPKEADHNLEAFGNTMNNCGEQGVSKGLKKQFLMKQIFPSRDLGAEWTLDRSNTKEYLECLQEKDSWH